MKQLRFLVLTVVLAVLMTAAAGLPALADPGDSAAGEFAYACPFTGASIDVTFVVEEAGDHLKGDGHATFAIPSRGATFEVKPKLVRVEGDEVFFAGPIVGANQPGGNAMWWYCAAKEGSSPQGTGGAFGMYIVGASKWDFVEQGVVLSGDFLPGDFQPLLSGWVTVDGS